MPQSIMEADVGRPCVATVSGHGIGCPSGSFGQSGRFVLPLLHVATGEDSHIHACRKDVVSAIFTTSHYGVVYTGMLRIKVRTTGTTALLLLLGLLLGGLFGSLCKTVEGAQGAQCKDKCFFHACIIQVLQAQLSEVQEFRSFRFAQECRQ